MRFLVAVGLFVLATALTLTGIAARTVFAPPAQYSMAFTSTSQAPYLEIPSQVISLHPGNPIVTASAAGKVFVSSGREADITAFVGQSPVASIAEHGKSQFLVQDTPGTEAPTDPAGSDLWRRESTGVAKASLLVDAEQAGAVLVASDGNSPAPNQVKIVWHSHFDPLLSNILIISGLVLLIVSAIITFMVFRQMRINRGPRRRTPKAPRPPRYRYRSVFGKPVRGRRALRFTALAATGLILSSVTACAPTKPITAASPTSSAQAQPVSLLKGQVQRILVDVAGVAKDADTSLNKDALGERFAGPALQVRLANYQLRKLNSRIAGMPAIAAKPIKFSLPAATATWPRTIMAVTDEPGDANLPQMIVLQQDSPRVNYKVWFTIRLMPGAKIPAVAPDSIGGIMVDPGSLFLKLTPNKIPAVFGEVLNNGLASVGAALFNLDNQFYKQVSDAQRAQAVKLSKANIVFKHTLGDPNVLSMATADGGALVAVYQNDVATIKPTKAGSAVAVGAEEKLLLGSNGSIRGVKSVYGDMLLFYVPAVDDHGQISLIGATQGLISISSL